MGFVSGTAQRTAQDGLPTTQTSLVSVRRCGVVNADLSSNPTARTVGVSVIVGDCGCVGCLACLSVVL